MSTQWPILALYSEALIAAGVAQKKALVCSRCAGIWEFAGIDTDTEIVQLAQSYGYTLVRHQVVCDDCIKEEKRR